MDGIHDLGGKDGHGSVEVANQPPGFAERWHAAVFTMVNSLFFAGITKNVDQFRHAVERIDPVSYLSDGYYGRWLGGIENILVESGTLKRGEISQRAAMNGADASARIASRPNALPDVFQEVEAGKENSGARREIKRAPRFQLDDRVRTQSTPTKGHTRLPAYVRGVVGVVIEHHHGWVLPDSHAHGQDRADHLYTICFQAIDVFGADSEAGRAGGEICVDLFESYLKVI